MSTLTVSTMHERGNRTVEVKFPSNYQLEGEYFGIVVTSTDLAAPGRSRKITPVQTEMFVELWNKQHVRVLAPILPLPVIQEMRRRTRHEESFEIEVDSLMLGMFVDDMRRMMSVDD